ncbi:unnamed protein product [Paramecium octaurelia]|uniref:Uncharacterized protein n=1 Tax=Paramecium octaurelia TaxID=43137 RepID=A0A8S1SBX2_PAROT|nr:unnamed protein product [Paramecium octaurelia]
MAINASTNLIAVQTTNAIKLIDPKTSSILQTIESDIKTICFSNQSILIFSSKNMLSCFDYQGLELWKQHIGGESSIVFAFEYHSIYGIIYANKDFRIYTQIQELKSTLDFVAKEINKVYHYQQYLLVVDDLQNNVNLFLLDDIVLLKTKPFKVFTGNNSAINDFVFKNVLATISKDKELIIFDVATTQIIFQTQLDSEPLALDIDLDYAYVGCVNKNIYQIKYNQQSINYTIQPTTQINKRKLLIGHLSEIKSVKLFFEDGHNFITSNSDDGQIFIWQVDGNQTTLSRKIVTLQAQKVYVVKRPQEHQLQSEEQILFKSKRLLQTKPLKKAKYTSNQLMICKKRIQKFKLAFNFTTQQPQNVIDPQINQIIEENQKLKQIIHQLL